jgi:hypothetical protein
LGAGAKVASGAAKGGVGIGLAKGGVGIGQGALAKGAAAIEEGALAKGAPGAGEGAVAKGAAGAGEGALAKGAAGAGEGAVADGVQAEVLVGMQRGVEREACLRVGQRLLTKGLDPTRYAALFERYPHLARYAADPRALKAAVFGDRAFLEALGREVYLTDAQAWAKLGGDLGVPAEAFRSELAEHVAGKFNRVLQQTALLSERQCLEYAGQVEGVIVKIEAGKISLSITTPRLTFSVRDIPVGLVGKVVVGTAAAVGTAVLLVDDR